MWCPCGGSTSIRLCANRAAYIYFVCLLTEGLSTGALVALVVSSAVVGVLLIGVIVIVSIRKCGRRKAKLQVTPNDPISREDKETQAVWSTHTDKS